MYDFITDLFNLDKKSIKSINITTSHDLTEIHMTLYHEITPCPLCHGVTHSHGSLPLR